MRYLGGKYRIRKWLAENINRFRKPGQPVWEPFCGGLNASAAIGATLCSDNCLALISLFNAIANGWEPPEFVSEEERELARGLPESDPLHGFCRFALSFGGESWGTMARQPGRNFASEAKRVITRDVCDIVLKGGSFEHIDFLQTKPGPTDFLICCDPPYRGRAGYGQKFNSDAFIDKARDWARFTTVIVSEYSISDEYAECVAETVRGANLRGKESTHTERLYLMKPKPCSPCSPCSKFTTAR